MSDDQWIQQKWKRDLERFLKGKRCPMCARNKFAVREDKVRHTHSNAAQPVAEVWCDDCGYVMSFVVT